MGDETQTIAVDPEDTAIRRPAQTGRSFGYRVEHRLKISRRPADDPQNLTGGCLPVEGLLCLVEQSHILDRNDGLVGEGLEERDLLVGERRLLTARHREDTDGATGAEQGNAEPRAIPGGTSPLPARIVESVLLEVEDVQDALLAGDFRGPKLAAQGQRVHGFRLVRPLLRYLVHCSQMHELAVRNSDHAEKRVAQHDRAPDDGVKHWLGIGRRARNHAQDLGRGGLLLLRLRLVSERLRQTLLQVADPGAVVLGGLAGGRGLGFLGLRGPWTSAHRPPLASYESAGDRLGERARVGKRSPGEKTLIPTTPTDGG